MVEMCLSCVDRTIQIFTCVLQPPHTAYHENSLVHLYCEGATLEDILNADAALSVVSKIRWAEVDLPTVYYSLENIYQRVVYMTRKIFRYHI